MSSTHMSCRSPWHCTTHLGHVHTHKLSAISLGMFAARNYPTSLLKLSDMHIQTLVSTFGHHLQHLTMFMGPYTSQPQTCWSTLLAGMPQLSHITLDLNFTTKPTGASDMIGMLTALSHAVRAASHSILLHVLVGRHTKPALYEHLSTLPESSMELSGGYLSVVVLES